MGHLKNIIFAQTGRGVADKSRLFRGKVRRFYLGLFGRRYLEAQENLRQGQCNRCGQCCKLLYVCPHLDELPDGTTTCLIHQSRPVNCRVFPIDRRDLADRALLAKHRSKPSCGFNFRQESEGIQNLP